ncbi:dioxygenase TauD/TfdA family protein [Steroidobacter agaridevorans]|uniref:Dioxygenase TauD/TfdA family protein n=1 Tax=Steroidobacter agaridevorans TaxID=2695856 RepID=A0A829YN89_9GAMM|nr:TauD/TfdA family dioxygenase [Steroidobacter agaridevorans]GFE84168.1 dioxygenase TauD/TfdA family protein [Steroidobacter agaridevorans]GFE86990.1 dioxygenase TauD/TfdA family protein [Steroidobacter agaridevorans]
MKTEDISPAIGTAVHVEKAALRDDEVARRCLELLEARGVLVFPRIGLNDEEQLAFTDKLGARVNFTSRVPGGNKSAQDVYTITLDPKINTEPEYVLGTYFWHMDGLTSPIIPPKASVLSARTVAPKGGQTEFASSYAAYEALPEEDKKDLEGLRVIHSVTAAVRAVTTPDALDATRRNMSHEHPLVWRRQSGRKTMLIGYTADSVVGMSQAEGRALLARLLEWTAQPAFTYRHYWQVGDLVIWDNTGALHRVVPYAADSGRRMHRTSVAGAEAVV